LIGDILFRVFPGAFNVTRVRRYYVGLAASLHDPAVAILSPDGKPLFVEASERYLQNKRAYHCTPDDLIRIPRLVRQMCDPEAELIVAVSWSDQMLRNLKMASFGAFMDPAAAASVSRQMDEFAWPMPGPELMLTGSRNSLSQAGVNLKSSRRIPNPVAIRRYDHHLGHAAHAACTSPFEECSVAVVDGYGEGRSTSFFRFRNGQLTAVPGQPWDSEAESRQHVSLGHFYARICAACGFDPILGEEWKVMGLAGYGRFDERIATILRPMVHVSGLGLSIGCPDKELADRLSELKGIARQPGAPAENFADLAATGQQVFEDLSTELLLRLHEAAPSENLALSGGCALNSSYNGRILERTPFRRLHVPSAPADDGCALGAAILAFGEDHPGLRVPAEAASAYLGSSMPSEALLNLRRFSGLGEIDRTREALIDEVSDLLKDGLILGWIQGQAEFGPRALGHRSILADARREEMKDRLNAIVKFREEFRPFAPSILDEHGDRYFENYQTSRYMERTLRFRQDKVHEVPAVVHVDGTGRLQSVRREWSPLFYDLIAAFYTKTGVPLILNTSLNVMGKPIAHSLEDGLGIFFTTGLDVLVVENCLLRKSEATNAGLDKLDRLRQ
jgi:carbamoyltransferase